MNEKKSDAQYTDDEIARRRDAALLKALSTPHKKQSEMKTGQRKSRKEPARATTTWPGTLVLGDSPQLMDAFSAIREGLQSGRRIDELRGHCGILEEAWGQALRTPEGLRYLEAHPTLKQQAEQNREKSGL